MIAHLCSPFLIQVHLSIFVFSSLQRFSKPSRERIPFQSDIEFVNTRADFRKLDELLDRSGPTRLITVSSPPGSVSNRRLSHVNHSHDHWIHPCRSRLLASVLVRSQSRRFDSLPESVSEQENDSCLIKESPHTAFIATEIINVLFHGMGSVGAVMFTFSGSLVNATMIYGVVPVQNFIGVCVSKMKAQAAELKAEVEAQKEAA